MALRINTNIAALNAHKNLTKTDNSLSSSLEKLSSGLRINKAADDASGMAIADSLKSQSLGLGQAIRNGNDAISIVQTADAALEESINIVNTIKTKSIQAAQDGQSSESRSAIQGGYYKVEGGTGQYCKKHLLQWSETCFPVTLRIRNSKSGRIPEKPSGCLYSVYGSQQNRSSLEHPNLELYK